MLVDLFQAVADLRSSWQSLHDIDKAEQIAGILATGMTGRTLARAVGCSESLIRHLNLLNDASPDDRRLARRGQLSTRELVRRAKERRASQVHRTATDLGPVEVAETGAKTILMWIEQEKLAPRYAEQILAEAEAKLFSTERTNTSPTGRAPVPLCIEDLVARCRPAECEEELNFVDWYAVWLARWAYLAIPTCRVRDEAFRLASAALARRR